MSAVAKRFQDHVVRIPEERVLTMIAACAEQITRVSSIEDAKVATDMAEAIAAVTRKVDVAKEVKRSAVRLLVDAEAKLGEILRAIPRASSTNGRKRKGDVLADHGISKARGSFAERLSKTPPEEIDRVIEKGARTIHGITSKLGFHTDGYTLRQEKASQIAFLCEEAVGLLERSVKRNEVPHAGTVAEMGQRWRTITAHGNTRA